MARLSDKAQRGVGAIADMLGPDRAEALRAFALSDRFGARLTREALELCYADKWEGGSLSRRDKSLLLIGALVALKQPGELANHVRLGLANGIAAEDLEEILLHLVAYVGFPAASTASAAMREVLTETASG